MGNFLDDNGFFVLLYYFCPALQTAIAIVIAGDIKHPALLEIRIKGY